MRPDIAPHPMFAPAAPPVPARRILHCDMDCFYAAVEVRDDPSLAGRPVCVGGDPRGRGVVAAANYEARACGIRSAMPASQAVRMCPDLVFLRPDFVRYKAASERIFAVYREFTPLVEPLSLDEAYLDVSAHLRAWGSATAVAREIRRRVREEVRLTVSVGVGPNMLVAKIASAFRKPDGLTVVPPDAVEAFLAPLPVRKLFGVGPAAERMLAELGVTTIEQLRALPWRLLLDRFGHGGATLYGYARGIDAREVQPTWERRSLGAESTYPRDLTTQEAMRAELTRLAREVARGLVNEGLVARSITLKARYPDFTTPTRSRSLRLATHDAWVIEATARELLARTEAARHGVRLLGISASQLAPVGVQRSLPMHFPPPTGCETPEEGVYPAARLG